MILLPVFWVVLLASCVAFWVLPRALRMGFLAAVSIGLLGWLAWEPVAGLLAWVIAFWFLVRGPSEDGTPRRSFHVLLILGVLGVLGWFKYLPPLMAALSTSALEAHVVVPLGMSFFTFKLVHYALEVHAGTVRGHRFSEFLCYMFLFPVFTAGPIERFDHFLDNREERWSLQSTADGLRRIAQGIVKRFLLAEACVRPLLGSLSDDFLADFATMPVWQVWCYLALSFLHIYLDFSAYSDIGIGASRLFGLRIMENFNFPFVACDISDFWKRWHISLSRWCQSYVYLPVMGYTRNPYAATFATFFVMGLWHAGTLNRIGWGLYHAIGIAIFVTWSQIKRRRGWKKLFKKPLLRYAGLPITLAFVAGSATFLAAEMEGKGLATSCRMLVRMIGIDVA
jgi:alginate O-acetyltransferase complex protein AlgI